MAHTKVLRGNLVRELLNGLCPKRGTKGFSSQPRVQVQRRCLSSQPAAAIDSKCLNSPWGEIEVGTETLTDFVYKDIELWADKPAVTCGTSGRSFDYGMLRMLVERCAAALVTELRLAPGDTLGLVLPNIPEFTIVVHGALRAGLVVTLVNPLYTADEIRRQFKDCGVKAIATIEMFMPVVKEVSQALKDYRGTIWLGGESDKAQGIYGLKTMLMADHQAELPTVNSDNVCLVPYSSGTTGMPKGVMLTHKNLVSNLKQVTCPKMMKYLGEKGHCETVLTVPPFFHIYGFNGVLNYCLAIGSHIVTLPKFTPEGYIQCLKEHRPQTLFVVPSLLAFLATHPAVTKDHLSSIESIMVGAAPTTDSMLEKFLLKVEKSKDEITLLQGYGMTESSPVTLMTPYKYPHGKVGSAGQLLPSTQAKIVSLSTGEVLGPHNSGELLLRGPQVMKGYWNNDRATRETVDPDGWLHTGDVAYYDEDHYFYIVDRTKELIKVKGNQVSPTEIESVIMELPQVADVAVVGVPDPLAGEVPRAFIVRKPKQELTAKEVHDLVNKKLTKYKHLDGGVAFIAEIPRNVAGKILRNELKVLGMKR